MSFEIVLIVAILIGVIAILVTLRTHGERLIRLRESIQRIPPSPEGTERILEQMRLDQEENRKQATAIRSRVVWLTGAYDALAFKVAELQRAIKQWLMKP